MNSLPYWNHNTAYYGWIKRKTSECSDILDVGCGDGTLVFFLEDKSKRLTGIDPYTKCIETALSKEVPPNIFFINTSFEDYSENKKFDAVIFSASIHHTDIVKSVKKAKSLLKKNGIIIIVGIASPSNIKDHIVEALRVIPSKIISSIKGIKPCEFMDIPISDKLNTMDEIRALTKKELTGAQLGYALHYRYLLIWKNK